MLRQAIRADRGPLQRFVCTDPEKAQHTGGRHAFHPAPWELSVQDHLRALAVPIDSGAHAVLVSEDDEGRISGVCDYGFDDSGESVIIFAIGVRQDIKTSGLGRRMLDEILASMVGDDVEFLARIDPRNAASKRLFASADFALEGIAEGFEIWVRGTTDVLAPDRLDT